LHSGARLTGRPVAVTMPAGGFEMIRRFAAYALVALLFALAPAAAKDAAYPALHQAFFRHLGGTDTPGADADYQFLASLIAKVAQLYVEPVEAGALAEAARRGVMAAPEASSSSDLVDRALTAMFGSLDPHSSFEPRRTYDELRARAKAKGGRLGLEVSIEGGKVRVVTPLDGSPGQRAGLRTGDVIAAVDGTALRGLTLAQVFDRLRGPAGSRVELTVRRPDGTRRAVEIERQRIRVPPVRHSIDGRIGVIRIASFAPRTERDVRKALVAFEKQLGNAARGYVIDLRSNPGGLLGQGILVADFFLDAGKIVTTRGRDGRQDQSFKATKGDLARGRPVVVLIDGGSASAAEVVSGALRDHKRAVLLGRKSYGKGTVQQVVPMGRRGKLRLTMRRYYTPAGTSIHKHGIVPDVRVGRGLGGAPNGIEESKCPPVGAAQDRPLGCAVALLRAGGLKPFLEKFGGP